ncbi:MAG: TRAP transporter large permease subunit, partial [Alphaproteobacteria bacterium]|nr:TRAP transporter large permease subunit [Alphaproteobacteria bacterium]
WFYVLGAAIAGFLVVVLASVGFAPEYATLAPFGAALALLALSQLPAAIRVPWERIRAFIEANGRLFCELVAILAAVGLIIGGLMMTGMAGSFSGELARVAGDQVIPLLLMGAATSFLLGVGMTVTAAYIFLAIVLAPALIGLGLDPVAVHLFILYWGMVSFITPPVALGAFAAASLAGATPMRTGLEAMRLGSIIYFLPFFFVLNPALVLNGSATTILVEVGTAIAGVVLIAAGLQGYLVFVGALRGAPAWLFRALLIAAGLALAYPEAISNLIGLALMLVIAAVARWRRAALLGA